MYRFPRGSGDGWSCGYDSGRHYIEVSPTVDYSQGSGAGFGNPYQGQWFYCHDVLLVPKDGLCP